MQIHQLVVLRKEILDYIADCSLDVTEQTHGLMHINESTARNTRFNERLSGVLSQYQQLVEQHNSIVSSLTATVADIESDIDSVVNHHTIQKNLQAFTEDQQYLPLEQTDPIPESVYQLVFSVISKHVDWHYPGLVINPRHKKWIDCLIATDPLYLTLAKIKQDDGSIETFDVADYYNRPQSKGYLFAEQLLIDRLKTVIASYSSLYQSRLRLYPIINKNYGSLPKQQFGLILAMETFNYLNQQEVERYLRSCFGLLRSGGTIIFNYVDCDIPVMAGMFDQGRVPYASTRHIKNIANDIGYQLLDTSNYQLGEEANGYLSLAILKKPGPLTTAKASQSKGKIIEK